MDWLLLIHQIPAKPTYFRAKIWRRLQHVGAVPIKQAVYAMPKQEQAYEDLTWIVKEIIKGGGEAILLEARFQEGLNDTQVINLFCEARQHDYEKITTEARELLADYQHTNAGLSSNLVELKASLAKLRKAFAGISAIDFFPVAERAKADAVLADLETILQQRRSRRPRPELEGYKSDMQGKTWVTRANVYVDRMASAWLIQRYIDRDAVFKFVQDQDYEPAADEIRFDMPSGEYTHEGDLCTFEVMTQLFGDGDRNLELLAGIIHDIDLKDDTFNLPETDGIHAFFDGIVAATDDDLTRIEHTGIVLDGLLAAFRSRNSSNSKKGDEQGPI
ncbi:MAG: chromate resistance protein ChrB domain-containing protein [Pseudomonadota bacterium]